MTDVRPEPVRYDDPALVAEVSAFLTYEADLLDRWRLEEWFALFTPDCSYHVPTTDRPNGDADVDLFFIRDDWFLLGQRVQAILNGTAWAESPRSITHRLVGNVRAAETADGVQVRANAVVHRSVFDRLDVYPYVLELLLVRGGHAGFEIRHRRATLALAQLRPHGRVSILL
ncbi:MAG: aromatic-ring-hydroxylating dioxygenase subunit beta [Acidimicrobiia bacterium]